MNPKVFTNTTEKTNENKTFLALFVAVAMLVSTLPANAQTVYYIGSSRNWAPGLPVNCTNCTINMTAGVVLTIDQAIVCTNCTFKGGTLSMKSGDLNIKFSGENPLTTVFSGTNLLVNGNTSNVIVKTPLSLNNSTFTFSNNTSFKTNYGVDLVASRINIYDNAVMIAAGKDAINLSQSSQIIIGNGSKSTGANFTVNGPALNAYDNSSIVLGNDNDTYVNSAKYNTATAPGAALKSYATTNSEMNCGSGYMHSCSPFAFYGPASLSAVGPAQGNILPVLLFGFAAGLNNDKTISISWDTKEETNFSVFNIERSADGSVWNTVGAVKAKGNSSVQSEYAFTDNAPLSGVNYYRLKVTDMDHRYGYTQLKVVRTSLISNISFYPNPATNFVNVSLGENGGKDVTIRLVNQAGQVLQEKRQASGAGSIVSLPVQQYNAGLYILSVTGSDGSTEISKVLIRRS